jgi:hypothetical protein
VRDDEGEKGRRWVVNGVVGILGLVAYAQQRRAF